ncbi:MAG: glycosyltransferase family 9 protein, partial [Nitrospinae bacterium]|nr:glycosyltransferase family 9 protein [Nitrospinota bacterium]
MKVDLMRKIDFYIGVPLCLFFSILFKIVFIFRRKGNIQPKNILFIELSEMGSAILVDPAMKKLQRSLTGSEL